MKHAVPISTLQRVDLLSAYLAPHTKRAGLTGNYRNALEAMRTAYAPVRHPTRLCVLYWLDTYGAMSTADLAELLHNTYTRSDVSRMLHSLASGYWVMQDTSGDTALWVYMGQKHKL